MSEESGAKEVRVVVFNEDTTEEEQLTPSEKWEQGDAPIVYANPGRIKDGSFRNKQRLLIETYSWLAEASTPARGDIIVVHGLGTHCRYTYLSHVDYEEDTIRFHDPQAEGSFVEAMTQQGFNVHGFDLQSYGQSEGLEELRGYFQSYDDHVKDLKQYTEIIKVKYEPKLLFVAGSSAGGCIAARLAEIEPDLYDGCILYAPMVSIQEVLDRPTNKVMLPIANCLASMLPTLRLGSTSPNTFFPAEEEYLKYDPLCDKLGVRLWTGLQTLNFVPSAAGDASLITTPLLVFHSVNDTNCAISASEEFVESVSSTDKRFVRLETEDSWHSLLVEPCRDEVVHASVEWLLNRS